MILFIIFTIIIAIPTIFALASITNTRYYDDFQKIKRSMFTILAASCFISVGYTISNFKITAPEIKTETKTDTIDLKDVEFISNASKSTQISESDLNLLIIGKSEKTITELKSQFEDATVVLPDSSQLKISEVRQSYKLTKPELRLETTTKTLENYDKLDILSKLTTSQEPDVSKRLILAIPASE